MTIEALRVRVITFNLGDQRRTKKEWYAEVSAHWTPVITFGDYDILLVSLQEDYSNAHAFGQLGTAIGRVLEPHGFVHVVAAQSTPTLPHVKYAVKANVYVRSTLSLRTSAPRRTCFGVDLKRKMLCTKSSVGVRLSTQDGDGALIFVASHLPIDTKRSDLGLDARVCALRDTMRNVVLPLTTEPHTGSTMILAGDLNFRRNPSTNQDQLSQLVLPRTPRLREAGPLTFAPTCKLNVCARFACKQCRTNNKISRDARPENMQCYNALRTPSHCDRVLYIGSHLKPVSYSDWTLAPAILASDHNAVQADFVWRTESAHKRKRTLREAGSLKM